MTDLLRVVEAEPVITGVLKIRWNDDHDGIVDLRPVIGKGAALAPLADPAIFSAVSIAPHGHGIVWLTEDGRESDFGADSLRERSDKQAQLNLLAS